MTDQARILYCCFDVVPGPHALSRRLAEYLSAVGDRFQVSILSTKTAELPHIERYRGSRLMRVPVGTGDLESRWHAFDRAVRRQLESEDYLVAHFFDPFGGYALCDGRAQHGHQLVYDASWFPSIEYPVLYPELEGDRRTLAKLRRQELFCLMNATVVLAGSPTSWQFIVDQGVPKSQVRVVRAPADLAPYTAKPPPKPDRTPMTLLHLGSHLPWQGLTTLLEAVRLASKEVELSLRIAGPSHPRWSAQLEEQIDALSLRGKVELVPPVPHAELPTLLASADVGVLALDDGFRNRGQGGSLARLSEYLAAGRPVLATDLPLSRDLVPDAAGVFVPPGDPEATAKALVALANDPRRRVKLGEAARAAAVAVDSQHVQAQLLALYAELAGSARPAPKEEGEITQLGPQHPKEPKARPPPALDPELHHELEAVEAAPAGLPPPVPSIPEAPPRRAAVAAAERDLLATSTAAPAKPSAKSPGRRPSRPKIPAVGAVPKPSKRRPSRTVPAVMTPPPVPSPPVAEPIAAAPALDEAPPPPTATLPAPLDGAEPTSNLPAIATPPPALEEDHPPEISDEELIDAAEGEPATDTVAPVVAAPSAPPPLPPRASAPKPARAMPPAAPAVVQAVATGSVSAADEHDDAQELDAEPIESGAVELPSTLDPWFAQLAHGYCPPEPADFVRPPPPTNFPGRDS